MVPLPRIGDSSGFAPKLAKTVKCRILALDGGGIRGIMTAIWLADLEDKLGSPVAESFDLIAGTSTGQYPCSCSELGYPGRRHRDVVSEKGRQNLS